MKWFKKNGDTPRLLSLSPLRADQAEATSRLIASASTSDGASRPSQSRRSRIDQTSIGGTWSPRKSSSNCYRVNTSTSQNRPESTANLNSSYHLSSQEKSKTLNALIGNRQNSGENTDLQNLLRNHSRKTLTLDRNEEFRKQKNEEALDDSDEKMMKRRDEVDYLDGGFDPDDQSLKIGDIQNLIRTSTPKTKHKIDSLCFTAKLKSMSDRYLKASTHKILAKLYRQQNSTEYDLTTVDTSAATTTEILTTPKSSISQQNLTGMPNISHRRKRGAAKLRSFSYGALPGVEEFRKNDYMFTETTGTTTTTSNSFDVLANKFEETGRKRTSEESREEASRLTFDNTRQNFLVEDENFAGNKETNEDCDSGIMVNDTSSVLACSVNESEQQEDKKPQLHPHPHPTRCASLDRQQILRNQEVFSRKLSSDNSYSIHQDVIYSQDTPIHKTSILIGSCDTENDVVIHVPPPPPKEKCRRGASEFRLIRLVKKFDGEDLGVVIDDVGCCRVDKIVEDGLADREGTLRPGDEIVNIGNQRLSKMSLVEINSLLNSTGSTVDLVIRRPVEEEDIDLEQRDQPPLTEPSPPQPSQVIKRRSPTDSQSFSSMNFCTLPRRPKSSACTFHTVLFEKGPGKKSLGFTVVGGRDSPKGNMGIFIKSILESGQASDDGRLKAGDEVLAVNGIVFDNLSHSEAVAVFKGIKSGPVALHVCRRGSRKV